MTGAPAPSIYLRRVPWRTALMLLFAAGVWLGVNQENERAQKFYAKSGFEKVGTKRFLVGDRYEDDYVFEQPL